MTNKVAYHSLTGSHQHPKGSNDKRFWTTFVTLMLTIIAEAVIIFLLLFACKPASSSTAIPINTVINGDIRYQFVTNPSDPDWVGEIDRENHINFTPDQLTIVHHDDTSITVSSNLPQYSGFVSLHYDVREFIHLDEWGITSYLGAFIESPTIDDIKLFIINSNFDKHTPDEWDGFVRNTTVQNWFPNDDWAIVGPKSVQQGFPKFLGAIAVNWTILP